MKKLGIGRFLTILFFVNISAFSILVGIAGKGLNTLEYIEMVIGSAILFGSVFGSILAIFKKLNSKDEKKNKMYESVNAL